MHVKIILAVFPSAMVILYTKELEQLVSTL